MTEPVNPYAAPSSNVDRPDDPGRLVDASKAQRFGTFVIDYIGIYAMAFVVGILIALIGGEAGIRMIENLSLLFGLGLMLAYYLFFEGLLGRTPGKFVCGTRVVTDNGQTPGLGDVLKRTLCRFIPFEAFSFFGERGWHDSISGTRVVRTRP